MRRINDEGGFKRGGRALRRHVSAFAARFKRRARLLFVWPKHRRELLFERIKYRLDEISEWEERQATSIEQRNLRADRRWEVYGRYAMWLVAVALVGFVFLGTNDIILMSNDNDLVIIEGGRNRIQIAALLLLLVGGMIAVWRGRQDARSLKSLERQSQATEFANYLRMAASESELAARAGFAGLEGSLPSFSDTQFKATYRLIMASLSIRSGAYSDIAKKFEATIGNSDLEDHLGDAIRDMEISLKGERSKVFRQEVFSFWREYTKARLMHISRSMGARIPASLAGHSLLFVEGTGLHGLNLSGLSMQKIRPVRLSREGANLKLLPAYFSECIFSGAQFGQGVGLTIHNSMCVGAYISPSDLPGASSLGKGEERLSFVGTHLCNSRVILKKSSKFLFLRANITGVVFSSIITYSGPGPVRDKMFDEVLFPFASRLVDDAKEIDTLEASYLKEKVYWIPKSSRDGQKVDPYSPEYALSSFDPSGRSSGRDMRDMDRIGRFWSKVRSGRVPPITAHEIMGQGSMQRHGYWPFDDD